MLFVFWHKPCTEHTQAVESKLHGELQTCVTYVQTDVPTIELLDLPGIQMYPPELYQQTTHLVNSYINAPDTLVLCVVDATIPSLDSSVAIKAVRDANKLPRTILALTKSDLIQDEESIVEQIFERVLGNSAETKDLAGLAGCVAVVNRVSQDHVTLIEAESAEQGLFSRLFADPAEAYAPPEVQRQLRSNTTTSQLIAQLDSLFHQHIVESWTPSALALIQRKLSKMQRSITRLGPAPESLDPTAVLKVLVSQVQLSLQSVSQPWLALVDACSALLNCMHVNLPVFALMHCITLCCAVLCCAVLCCAVLCCAVLCCAVLCCAVLATLRGAVLSWLNTLEALQKTHARRIHCRHG